MDWYISTSGHSYQKWCTVWDSLIQATWQTQRSHMSCAEEAFSALRAQGVIFSAGVSELHSQKEYTEAGALNSSWFVTLENVSAECLGAYKRKYNCLQYTFLRHSLEIIHRCPRGFSSSLETFALKPKYQQKDLKSLCAEHADLKFLISWGNIVVTCSEHYFKCLNKYEIKENWLIIKGRNIILTLN